MQENKEKQTMGLVTVTSGYVLWGLLAIYWSFLGQVNAVFILAQRIVWSLVFMAAYLLVTRRWKEAVDALRSRATMSNCFLCGVLITLNWGIYIYAVNSGHVLQASMGYFIEPVLVGLMGVIAFRERPSKAETATFLIAGVGIAYPGPGHCRALHGVRGAEKTGPAHGPDLPVHGDAVHDALCTGVFCLVVRGPRGDDGGAGRGELLAPARLRCGDVGPAAAV